MDPECESVSAARGCDAFERLRHAQRVRLAFDRIGAGDQKEPGAPSRDRTLSDADSR